APAPGGFGFSGVVVDLTDRRADEVRLGRLQEFTEALGRRLTVEQIADEIVRRGRAIVGAVAAVVWLRQDDSLEMVAYAGDPNIRFDPGGAVPLDHDIPAAEAVRTGKPLILTAADVAERFPRMASGRRLPGDGQLVALPLTAEGSILGAIVLRMPAARQVTHADRVVLEVLSRAAAFAIERAAQTSAEHAAHRAAEEANAVLDAIISTAPEGFALFDTDLRFVRVNRSLAEINGIPAAEHVGRTLGEVVPNLPTSQSEAPLRQVLATNRPVLDVEVNGRVGGVEKTWLISHYPVPDPAGRIAFVGAIVTDITVRKRNELRSERLAQLGTLLDEVVSVEERMNRLVEALVPSMFDFCAISFRGADGALQRVALRGDGTPDVSVPLVVRGRDLGVLAVGRASFGHDEAIFAEEVGRRAALAVDNARLFEAEQVARDRTATQYALAAALAEALTPADVAAAALSEVVPAVGAEHGTMWQVTEDGRSLEAVGWMGFDDDEMQPHLVQPLRERRPVADSIRARRTLWFASPEEIDRAYPAMAQGLRARRLRSAAAIPLLSAGRVVGGLFLSSTQPYALTADDLALAGALAAQAAQALERARLYAAERQVSVTLQRSLLPPELPEVDGVDFELRYLPAAGLEAGGDFYEALELPDGTVLFACGDVVGRGATAAAAMGQLRSALRAFALMGGGPSEILSRLSTFADTIDSAMAATAAVGKLDPASGELRYACAGHPWPLLVHPDARAEYLTEGRGVPLGCVPRPDYPEATVTLERGSTLVLYTDGLTERRDEDVAVVLERLRSVAAASAVEPLAELLDSAVAVAGVSTRADDIALVGLRLTERGASTLQLSFPGELDQVPLARAAVRTWLAEHGVGGAIAADLLLAAGEAFANAVEHSGSETVDLELTRPAARQVAIVVRDRGAWRVPPDETDRGRGFGL
ncbi:MAG: hypothetical protein QOF76_4284, partial [Solirubrobacteraceae bacterium]|nr:hypothetical protein [Solirubrobacteraceae bacterium]